MTVEAQLAGEAGGAEVSDGPLRVVFFGTPSFAVPTLERLAGDERFDVALVVTQPDRPAGRGRRLEASAVKQAAARLGLTAYQPATLRDADARRPLVAAGADLFVVAAVGLIFGRSTLAIPRIAPVNVHASLLPQYRGASPVAAAILNGDERTGVTLMVMESGLDTGPVFARVEAPILPDDTTTGLTDRLSRVAADLVDEALAPFAAGQVRAEAQPTEGASVTRPLTKADGWLDWSRPAAELERSVRAMWAWPRAWSTVGDEAFQVHAATVVAGARTEPAGNIVATRNSLQVACGRDRLFLDVVQPAGGRPMPGAAFATGRRLAPGDLLGQTGAPEPQPPLVRPVGGAE